MSERAQKFFIPFFAVFLIFGCTKEKEAARSDLPPLKVLSVIGAASRGAPGVELKVNDTVKTGDRIITGDKSMVVLEIPDRSAVRIYENSSFTVRRRDALPGGSAPETQLYLDKGKSLLVIEKLTKGGTIAVRTPTAVASVRGTSFVVAVNADRVAGKAGTTGVKVIRGAVEVRSGERPAEKRVIRDGETVVVSGDAVVEDTKKIPENELMELKKDEKDLGNIIVIKAEKVTIKADKVIIKTGAPPQLKSENAIREYYNKLEEISLDDGSMLVGAVIFQDAASVKIHTVSGVIQVPTQSVKHIRMR